MIRRLRPLALAAALSIAGIGAAAAGAPDLSLKYRATLAGLGVGSMTASLSAEDGGYRLNGRLATEGPLTLLLPWQYEAISYGRIEQDRPVPVLHWSAGRYKGEPRHIQVSFAPDAVRIDSAEPDPAEKPKRIVPPALRRGTLDPLSALLALGRDVGESGRCNQKAAVFDGRLRYDLYLRDDPAVAPQPGAPVRCRFFYEPIAGFKESHKSGAASKKHPGTVWFQQVKPGLPAVPARIDVESDWGHFVLELTDSAIGENHAAAR